MLTLFSNKYLVTIFRIAFVLIFLFAGMGKVADLDAFKSSSLLSMRPSAAKIIN
jgi:hypothetical protein